MTRAAAAVLCIMALGACDREARLFRQPATAASTPPDSRVAELQTAAATTGRERIGPYDANAWSVSQGKRLYSWFNCSGCHGHSGGGGMGPALMDNQWLYGHESQDVFTSITKGRPNGMPAYGQRISEQQVWQLVAYVRSMSGLIPHDALPGRNDALHAVTPEMRREPLPPVPGTPPAQPADKQK